MKIKQLHHIIEFGMVTCEGSVMPPIIFPHGLRFNTEAYIKRVTLDDPPSVNRTMRHSTHIGKLSVGCDNISVITSTLTSV